MTRWEFRSQWQSNLALRWRDDQWRGSKIFTEATDTRSTDTRCIDAGRFFSYLYF